MVDQAQVAGGAGGGRGGEGAGAGERAVEVGERGDAEGRLEDEIELGEQVREGAVGGDAGDERDEAGVGADERLERRPRSERPGRRGGGVAIARDTGGAERGAERRGGNIVRVDEKEGDDLVGVGVHPGLDRGKPGLERPAVEQRAAGVAELERAVLVVDLGLEEADAG